MHILDILLHHKVEFHRREALNLFGKDGWTWSDHFDRNNPAQATHFSIKDATWGWYSTGANVAKANFATLQSLSHKLGMNHEIRYGDFGSTWLCFEIATITQDEIEAIWEVLERLQSYPCLDDDKLESITIDAITECAEELVKDCSIEVDFDVALAYCHLHATEQDGGRYWTDLSEFETYLRENTTNANS